MDEWGFVLVAYGVAGVLLLFYTAGIKGKIKRLEKEIRVLDQILEKEGLE